MSVVKIPQPVYVRTTYDGSRIRVKALPGQTIKGSEEMVSTSANINFTAIREHVAPVGSTFVILAGLTLIGSFYKPITTDFYCVASSTKSSIDASEELLTAYKDYLVSVSEGSEEGIPPFDEDEVPEEKNPKKIVATTLDILTKKFPVPDPAISKFFIERDTWYHLLLNSKLRKNTLLVGPTGSGKTEITNHLAAALNRQVEIFDMGTMHDPLSGLLGTHRLKEGKSVFDPSRFSRSIQVKNNTVLLDELNRAPFTANNILFPVFDNRRTLYVDIAESESSRLIPVHESVVFFATANVGMEYTGTGEIDRALKDRFTLVELSYMPRDVESRMLIIRHEVDSRVANIISTVAEDIRTQAQRGELSTAVSTRHTLEVAEMVSHGYEVKAAMEKVFLPMFENSMGGQSERVKVRSIITSR